MKAFAALYRELDASTSSLAKQAALQTYLREAPPADAAWAVYFLAGGKPRQIVPVSVLRELAREAAGLPDWLFEESYQAVGDVITADGDTIRLSALRVPVYLSPGESRDEVRIESGVETHYPFNYAVNVGTWLVWDPATATGGSGVAYPDSKVKTAQVRDGLSMTMGFAEVKGWQPYLRNRGNTAAALSVRPAASR